VALTAALPALPLRTAQLIASAERVGRLPQALHRLTRPGRAAGTAFASPRGANAFLHWYPVLTLAILIAVALMSFVFVVPKFEAIFHDFSVPLPPLTLAVLAVGRWSIGPLAVVFGLILVALLARTVGTMLAPRWAATNPFRMVTDRVAWFVPPLRAVVQARALGDACHVAADALESGRPLLWAVEEAARAQSNVVLACRLADCAEIVRHGIDAADAARTARLPDLLVGLLRSTPGADLADLFRFLARYYDGRFSRGMVLLRAAFVPAAAIGCGVPVCLFVLGLYLPMIQLMDHLSEIIWTM
jgi:type IV pilus assembly protein PilC